MQSKITKSFNYGYTRFDKIQKATFEKCIKGKTILDIGCGRGELSQHMAKTSATYVYAIDKEFVAIPNSTNKIVFQQTSFDTFYNTAKLLSFDIAVLAWPINNYTIQHGLDLALLSPEIIVITKNSEGTCCGNLKMYETLSKLQIVAYVPRILNTLSIYKNISCCRQPTKEEINGMSPKIQPFEKEPDIILHKKTTGHTKTYMIC